jgi:hypothetical protein
LSALTTEAAPPSSATPANPHRHFFRRRRKTGIHLQALRLFSDGIFDGGYILALFFQQNQHVICLVDHRVETMCFATLRGLSENSQKSMR